MHVLVLTLTNSTSVFTRCRALYIVCAGALHAAIHVGDILGYYDRINIRSPWMFDIVCSACVCVHGCADVRLSVCTLMFKCVFKYCTGYRINVMLYHVYLHAFGLLGTEHCAPVLNVNMRDLNGFVRSDGRHVSTNIVWAVLFVLASTTYIT